MNRFTNQLFYTPFLSIIVLVWFSSCKNVDHGQKFSEHIDDSVKIKEPDVFYQFSIWEAFVNKIFEGDLSAEELKAKGDLALGSFNLLDGEMIMLNGNLYQASEDGKVNKPADTIKIAYANAAFFDTDFSFRMPHVKNYESLRQFINEKLPSKNFIYAFKIHGEFSKMKCGGLRKQHKPFEKRLDVLAQQRPIFERKNFMGTIVGFYCPSFINKINVTGYHLHFVSDDEQFAGHVIEFEAKNLKAEMDQMDNYQFELPRTKEFQNLKFDND